MQHFDPVYGTRMLDVTSSIFCGLFFACAGWDGSVNDKEDGRLYIFPMTTVRGEDQNPFTVRGRNCDINDKKMDSANSYFDIEAHEDTVRIRTSPFRNNREIAQDGYFIWQPQISDAINPGQYFDFRVARDCKIQILQELYSIDYTAERIIRDNEGQIAQTKVNQAIGVT